MYEFYEDDRPNDTFDDEVEYISGDMAANIELEDITAPNDDDFEDNPPPYTMTPTMAVRAAGAVLSVVALGLLPGEPVHHEDAYFCAADVRSSDDRLLSIVPGTLAEVVCNVTVATNQHWAEKGYPEVVAIPVVYLGGPNDEFACSDGVSTDKIVASEVTAAYCNANQRIVVSGVRIVEHVIPYDPTDLTAGAAAFAVAHEQGHAAQAAAGQQFFDAAVNPAAVQRSELQADCLAAQAVEGVMPDLSYVAMVNLGRFDQHDVAHGTPRERQAAYRHGSSGEACDYVTLEESGIIYLADELNTDAVTQLYYNRPR